MERTTERELQDFVAREARLIDTGRWDEWQQLFADDGRYWVPLQGAAQADDGSHNALADEDRLLLALRVQRLQHPRAHSEHPRTRCQHVLQPSLVVARDEDRGVFELETPFLYIESQGERQLLLAGCVRHRLVRRPEGLRIALKRVDLADAGQPLPAIHLFP